MALIGQACRSYRGILIRDHGKGMKWAYRLSVKPSPSVSLEEEIHILRRRMELIADREQSLTSPRVIEISMRLDKKLNEYMRLRERA